MRATEVARELLAAQDGLCALCRLPCEPEQVTLDHIIPKSLGGTSERSNLQAAHWRCNVWKASIENGWVMCLICRQQITIPFVDRHYTKRHPANFPTVKAWRKAAKKELRRQRAAASKAHVKLPKRLPLPRDAGPVKPWPAPNYVPRTGPYASGPAVPASNGMSAEGVVGSP